MNVIFTPRPLYSGEKIPGIHSTGAWVGPTAGLDNVKKILDYIGTRIPTVEKMALKSNLNIVPLGELTLQGPEKC
jgi:hypothetical protein